MEGKLPKGASITDPPIFDGTQYFFWKAKIRVYIKAINFDLWNVFQEGNYMPYTLKDGVKFLKPEEEYNEEDKRLMTLNSLAIHILLSALSLQENLKIYTLPSARDMWLALEADHEGPAQIKEALTDLCLAAQDDEKEEDEESDSEPTFEELFSEYNSLHAEYKKVSKELRASKNKVKTLEEQVQNLSCHTLSCENNSEKQCNTSYSELSSEYDIL